MYDMGPVIMKLSSGFSIIIFISVALSGCDHGYNTSTFSGTAPVFDCSSTATNGGTTSCIPVNGSGGSTPTTTGAVITADNYQFLAGQISSQLDHLIRHRSGTGNPLTLAELGLLLLQRVQHGEILNDSTVTVCTNDPTSLNISTSSSGAGTTYTLDFENCIIGGIASNGSVQVSDFTVNGDNSNLTELTNESVAWDAQASISIGSFGYTLSADQSLNFTGSVDISVVNDLSSATIDTTLTLTNFLVSENNSADTFTTATLTSSDNSNTHSVNVSATMDNTSATQSTLNITSSDLPPLTWNKLSGSDNPSTGSLFVTASDNASTLTLSANGTTDTMTVTLNNGSATACTTWADLNPAACGP